MKAIIYFIVLTQIIFSIKSLAIGLTPQEEKDLLDLVYESLEHDKGLIKNSKAPDLPPFILYPKKSDRLLLNTKEEKVKHINEVLRKVKTQSFRTTFLLITKSIDLKDLPMYSKMVEGYAEVLSIKIRERDLRKDLQNLLKSQIEVLNLNIKEKMSEGVETTPFDFFEMRELSKLHVALLTEESSDNINDFFKESRRFFTEPPHMYHSGLIPLMNERSKELETEIEMLEYKLELHISNNKKTSLFLPDLVDQERALGLYAAVVKRELKKLREDLLEINSLLEEEKKEHYKKEVFLRGCRELVFNAFNK